MKQFLRGAAVVVSLLLPAAAQAADGFATANVNLRSGPSTSYPAVAVIPAGRSIEVFGCLNSTPWCDVSVGRWRGWVAARYIQTTYRNNRVVLEPRYYRPLGIPTVTFEIGNYWDRYYRNRDFYGQRDRYDDNYRPPRRDSQRPRRDWNQDDQGWDRNRPRRDWNETDDNWNRDRNRPRRDWNDNEQTRDQYQDPNRDRDRNRPRPENPDYGNSDNQQQDGVSQSDLDRIRRLQERQQNRLSDTPDGVTDCAPGDYGCQQ
jgi:uncharacterized protein YraI